MELVFKCTLLSMHAVLNPFTSWSSPVILVPIAAPLHGVLTNLGREFAIGDFDVSADGREIIFDRARDESGIVLFDLRIGETSARITQRASVNA